MNCVWEACVRDDSLLLFKRIHFNSKKKKHINVFFGELLSRYIFWKAPWISSWNKKNFQTESCSERNPPSRFVQRNNQQSFHRLFLFMCRLNLLAILQCLKCVRELHFLWYQVFKQCKASGPLQSRSCSVCCTLKCWTISCRQQWVLVLGFKSYSCVLRWTYVVFIFQIVMLKLQLLEQRKLQSLNW